MMREMSTDMLYDSPSKGKSAYGSMSKMAGASTIDAKKNMYHTFTKSMKDRSRLNVTVDHESPGGYNPYV